MLTVFNVCKCKVKVKLKDNCLYTVTSLWNLTFVSGIAVGPTVTCHDGDRTVPPGSPVGDRPGGR